MALTVLITGASSGIGEAVAREFATQGDRVWLAARRLEKLEAIASDIQAAGGTAHPLRMDVGEFDATSAATAALDDEVGGLDMVIANAGIAGARAAVQLSQCAIGEAGAILQVNTLGAVATLMPLVGRMKARRRGHLVGVTSMTVDAPNPRTAPYGASKAALRYFLRCADMELRPYGVAVSEIVPGFVNTPAAHSVEDEWMPMMWEPDRAARYLIRKLRQRRRVIRFPWLLHAYIRLLHAVLPPFLYDPISRRLSGASS